MDGNGYYGVFKAAKLEYDVRNFIKYLRHSRDLLTPLETVIRHSLIPSITGKNDLNNHMRRIMALPTRLGGLSLDDPQSESKFEYSASCNVGHPISELILQQSGQLNSDKWRSKDRQGQQSGKR